MKNKSKYNYAFMCTEEDPIGIIDTIDIMFDK